MDLRPGVSFLTVHAYLPHNRCDVPSCNILKTSNPQTGFAAVGSKKFMTKGALTITLDLVRFLKCDGTHVKALFLSVKQHLDHHVGI